MIRKSILSVAFMEPEKLQLPRTRLRTKFNIIILRQSHILRRQKRGGAFSHVCGHFRVSRVSLDRLRNCSWSMHLLNQASDGLLLQWRWKSLTEQTVTLL